MKNGLFYDNIPDMNKLSGGVYSEEKIKFNNLYFNDITQIGSIVVFKNVLNRFEIEDFKKFFPTIGNYSPVSVQGMADVNDEIGSERITAYMPELARAINLNLNDLMDIKLEANDFTPTDWHQGNMGNTWELIGVSPMFRYMKYTKGGKHYPHYDAGFIYDGEFNEFRTLYSFVLYLTTNNSGATRFIKDGQENTRIQDRNHNDWDREATEDEVFFQSLPEAGKLVIFPHRLCHDVSEFTDDNSERIIIRGDILFKLKK